MANTEMRMINDRAKLKYNVAKSNMVLDLLAVFPALSYYPSEMHFLYLMTPQLKFL